MLKVEFIVFWISEVSFSVRKWSWEGKTKFTVRYPPVDGGSDYRCVSGLSNSSTPLISKLSGGEVKRKELYYAKREKNSTFTRSLVVVLRLRCQFLLSHSLLLFFSPLLANIEVGMLARYGRVNMRLQEEDNTAHKMSIRGGGNKKKNRRFDGKNNTRHREEII